MKATLKYLLLTLLLVGTVAVSACQKEEAEVPTEHVVPPEATVPAPDPAPAEEIQTAPFESYFDLNGLSQESLSSAVQTIDQESTANDVTIQVNQTIGDGQNILYVSFDMIYPSYDASETVGIPEVMLVEGAVTDPSQEESCLGISEVSVLQTEEAALSYLAVFSQLEKDLNGKEVSLILTEGNLPEPVIFTWTLENNAFSQEIDIVDKNGAPAGQASLTPFALSIVINDDAIDGFLENATITLLDKNGTPLPETWSISGDFSFTYLEFFKPMEPGTIASIQVGPYTGQF